MRCWTSWITSFFVFFSLITHSNAYENGIDFAWKLHQQVAKTQQTQNFILAPEALRLALKMMIAPSSSFFLDQTPELWKEIQQTKDQFFLANRLWIDLHFTLTPDFLSALHNRAWSQPWLVNFEAPDFVSDRINEWTEAETAGKIKNILSEKSLELSNQMILTSAFAFQGRWQFPFDPKKTMKESFTSSAEKTSSPLFMHVTGNFLYTHQNAVQFIDLPLVNRELALTLILPPNSDEVSLDTIQNGLKSLKLTWVDLALPQFEITGTQELHPILQELIHKKWNTEITHFSHIVSKHTLELHQIFQKTKISVQESGILVDPTNLSHPLQEKNLENTGTPPVLFQANRPFLFLLRHRNSNAVLLTGQCFHPMETLP